MSLLLLLLPLVLAPAAASDDAEPPVDAPADAHPTTTAGPITLALIGRRTPPYRHQDAELALRLTNPTADPLPAVSGTLLFRPRETRAETSLVRLTTAPSQRVPVTIPALDPGESREIRVVHAGRYLNVMQDDHAWLREAPLDALRMTFVADGAAEAP